MPAQPQLRCSDCQKPNGFRQPVCRALSIFMAKSSTKMGLIFLGVFPAIYTCLIGVGFHIGSLIIVFALLWSSPFVFASASIIAYFKKSRLVCSTNLLAMLIAVFILSFGYNMKFSIPIS